MLIWPNLSQFTSQKNPALKKEPGLDKVGSDLLSH